MIDQPHLGSKLLELRIQKGMTQHELRELSHVSVRTIQRIESGAVTPRASTIKILLEALGEDRKDWFESSNVIENKFSIKTFKTMLLVNTSEIELKKALSPAWISGIIYLLIVIIDQGLGFIYDINSASSILSSMVIVKLIAIASFFFFTRGFIALAFLFENNLLRVASYISLATISLYYFSEALILLSGSNLEISLGALYLIPLGAVSLILGIALFRLQDGMGRIAKIAGRLEIAFGLSYLTIIFSFVGLILLAPLLVVEIVLLSKADQLAKEGQL